MTFQLAEPLNPSETGLVLLLELLCLLLLLELILLDNKLVIVSLLIPKVHLIQIDAGVA